MPEYKLVYFNGTGRAELIRWLFAYGGVKYTDDRFDMSEWAARKTKTYGGRVPLLMVDDKPLPQSLAQARYAAREVGLMPTDSLQAAYCDAVVDSIEEIYCKYFPLLFFQGTEGEIANKFKELHTSAISPFADKLNKRLKEKQWFVGDQVSWADFAIAVAADQMKQKMPYILEKYPAVDQHVKKVMDLPQIKAWVAKRPKGLF